MPKTKEEVSLSTEQIDAELDQLQAQLRPLQEQVDEIRTQIKRLQTKRVEMTTPFTSGDIVEDEMGVKYRVTDLNTYGRAHCNGIRLTKDGYEAYQNPRPIYSNKLKKVIQ